MQSNRSWQICLKDVWHVLIWPGTEGWNKVQNSNWNDFNDHESIVRGCPQKGNALEKRWFNQPVPTATHNQTKMQLHDDFFPWQEQVAYGPSNILVSLGAGTHATNADAVEDWYLKVAGKAFTRL